MHISSTILDNLMALFTIKYIEKGSNHRPHQEQAFIHFHDFLDECAGKYT